MEMNVVVAVLATLGEAGIFGLGWVAFLWAMMQLRYERSRYQQLVIHIIEYFTKVSILKDIDDGNDSSDRPVSNFDGGLGRIFDSGGDGLAGIIPSRRRERSERTRRRTDRKNSD